MWRFRWPAIVFLEIPWFLKISLFCFLSFEEGLYDIGIQHFHIFTPLNFLDNDQIKHMEYIF